MIPKNIVIVGGGTAGWMSACLLANKWQKHAVTITLVESNKIGTIGVGEGSTPFLRQFFQTLNITENEWMPACDATYKCGIDFPNWCNDQSPQTYFHPFYSEIDGSVINNFFKHCQERREGYNTQCLPDDYFITSYLAKLNKAPHTKNNETLGVDYGYHFDAVKLGNFLASHAKNIGVIRIQDKVVAVQQSEQGIGSIETQKSGTLNGDLFVDCSGFSGLLIQQTLGESLINYQKFLPNNRAVAIATAHCEDTPIGCCTISKGLTNGWMWSIPLQSRVGNGYVYSDNYISPAQAETELREQLNEHESPALHLQWTPGRISNHWKQNCLAVGLSQGFLEPLEAPMLNLVQQTCEAFIEYIEKDDVLEKKQNAFNAMINRFIDGTRDYLQTHYALTNRDDSDYWIDNRNNKNRSPALQTIIDGWKAPETFESALVKYYDELVYGKTSWYCIFSGMGYFNAHHKGINEASEKQLADVKAHCEQLTKKFINQSNALKSMHESN
jgi:flavin-dependent dehydrogenase